MTDKLSFEKVTVLRGRQLHELRKWLRQPVGVNVKFVRHGRPVHVLATLSMHPMISSLSLGGDETDFEPGDMETCTTIAQGFTELKRLRVAEIDLDEDLLSTLVTLPKLEELKLSNLTLHSSFVPLVQFMRTAPSGGTLDLKNVHITGDNWHHLARQSLVTSVRIRDCGLTDEDAEALVSVLSGCTELEHLDLSHNAFSFRAVNPLMRIALLSKSISLLDLRGNDFNYVDKEKMQEVASAKIMSILV